MNSRKILIANTKTQRRYEIMTDATTLGELKAAMDANGIDYEGMSFTEGISKTELTRDDSQLPKDVMYKGQTTNELIFVLTNTKKNIASGAEMPSRKDIYQIIKDNELQESIKEEFGDNYTRVGSEDLWKFVCEHTDVEIEEDADEEEDEEDIIPEDPRYYYKNKANDLYDEIKYHVNCDDLDAEAVRSIAERCEELANRMEANAKVAEKVKVTDDETNSKIDDIIAGL